MRKIIYLLFVLSAISCSNRENNAESYLKLTDTISLESILLEEELIYPSRIICLDDYLVIYNRKGDKVFTIFKLPLDGKSFSAGFRGNGPGEFNQIDEKSFRVDGNILELAEYDGTIKRVKVVQDNLDVTEEKISNKAILYNGLLRLKDYYIKLNETGYDGEYVLYSLSSGESRIVSNIPNWCDVDGPNALFAYAKYLVPHPSGEKFASFYLNLRKFRILKQDGTTEYDVDVSFPFEMPEYEQMNRSRFLAYASYPHSTNNSIVALCKNLRNGETASYTELQVWDWNGKLKCRLILDRYITFFTLDKDGILYACTTNEPEVIYRANLSKYI